METKSEIKKLWECPNCRRQFERKSQAHSCKIFPLEQHFKGKEKGKILYEKLRMKVKKRLGSFRIESLECCIHFVSTFTFSAVKILKDKIRVDFSLDHKIKSKRINQDVQISANRYLYTVDIFNEDEINEELIKCIQKAKDKE